MLGALGKGRVVSRTLWGLVAAVACGACGACGCQGHTGPDAAAPAVVAAPVEPVAPAAHAAASAPSPAELPDAREAREARDARQQPAGGPWVTPSGRFVLRAHARGVQVYRAARGRDGRPTWTSVAAAAELTDAQGKVIGRHYTGPSGLVWEGTDGSRVVGRVLRERPSPDPDAIPERQIEARPVGGEGVLSGVTFIERLDTTGGRPPPATSSAQPGKELNVPYTADYVFYAAKE